MTHRSRSVSATPAATVVPVRLRLVSRDLARRIQRRRQRSGDNWAAGYPSDGDVEAVDGYLQDLDAGEDPGPFGPYEILLEEDLVIGQVGFHGPPDRAGAVEVGYGVAPTMRNRGYATAALLALLEVAFARGVARVEARADPANRASRRVMEKAGLAHVGFRDGLVLYAITAPVHSSAVAEH